MHLVFSFTCEIFHMHVLFHALYVYKHFTQGRLYY